MHTDTKQKAQKEMKKEEKHPANRREIPRNRSALKLYSIILFFLNTKYINLINVCCQSH